MMRASVYAGVRWAYNLCRHCFMDNLAKGSDQRLRIRFLSQHHLD